MNVEEFRKIGKEIVDFICVHYENINENVCETKIQTGYLKNLIPENPPKESEQFVNIFQDFLTKIMPGICKQNPAEKDKLFSTEIESAFPFILGELLSSSLGTIGFSWASCPASTELEIIILDWYAKALNLPTEFLSSTTNGNGGGALQSSNCECVLVCLLAARADAIRRLKGNSTGTHDSIYLPQLTAYASKDSNAAIRRAAKIALIKLRLINTDQNGRMMAEHLQAAITNDLKAGMTPFFVAATVDIINNDVDFDVLLEIGHICKSFDNIWFHIDGSHGGNIFMLPEREHHAKSALQHADSFNVDPNELLLTKFDCSAVWVRDMMSLKYAFNVDPLYLQHDYYDMTMDFRHCGIPLSRRFRALSLWFSFRTYGIAKIQNLLRSNFGTANNLKSLSQTKDNTCEYIISTSLGTAKARNNFSPLHVNPTKLL